MDRFETQTRANERDKRISEFHFSSRRLSFVAFYSKDGRLACVLDITRDDLCPDYMLMISPQADADGTPLKWDAILKDRFDIDPNAIRPKNNTKYEKLSISYASLEFFETFISSPIEEVFLDLIERRIIAALDSAYAREAESTLTYNIASATRVKAAAAVEALQKSVVRLTKRLQKEESGANPDPEIIEKTTASLYAAAEKLKRAERRGKRAVRRLDSGLEDLNVRRRQIALLRAALDAGDGNSAAIADKRAAAGAIPGKSTSGTFSSASSEGAEISGLNTSATTENQVFSNISTVQPTQQAQDRKNVLTEGVNSATTKYREKEKENIIMARDENRTNSEFKPPVADNAQNRNASIRFAKSNTVEFGSNRPKIGMYAAAVAVSLILILGIFYLLSGDKAPRPMEHVDNFEYVEPAYEYEHVEEMVAPEPVEAYVDSLPPPPPVAPPPPAPRVVKHSPAKKPAARTVPAQAPVETVRPVESAPVYTVPAPEPDTYEEVAESFDELNEVIADDLSGNENETELSYADEDSASETVGEEFEAFDLDSIRTAYIENVLDDDRYTKQFNTLIYVGFSDVGAAEPVVTELRDLNRHWNAFRNAAYVEYYTADGDVKDGIDFEQFAADEDLLRLYSYEYFKLYEFMVNEFSMTYEFANSPDLYDVLEDELQDFGRPNAKLALIETMFRAMYAAGGPEKVVFSVDEHYDMQRSGTIIPLTESIATGEPASALDEMDLVGVSYGDAEYMDAETGETERYEFISEVFENEATGEIEEFVTVYDEEGNSRTAEFQLHDEGIAPVEDVLEDSLAAAVEDINEEEGDLIVDSSEDEYHADDEISQNYEDESINEEELARENELDGGEYFEELADEGSEEGEEMDLISGDYGHDDEGDLSYGDYYEDENYEYS